MSPLKRWFLVISLVSVTVMVALYEWPSHSPPPPPKPTPGYLAALVARTSPGNRTILLAMVDVAFADLAVNFYLMSLLPHGITNFLFVGASHGACDLPRAAGAACFPFREDPDSGTASLYLSKNFLRKMNIRSEMILEALWGGFTVIHTDLDVAFLRNPLPLLSSLDPGVDVACLWDDGAYNAGFLMVRASQAARSIYSRVLVITGNNPRTDDQTALNTALAECSRRHQCHVTKLDEKRFLNGLAYFERTPRPFAGHQPCAECTVVHNNWIVSREAKIYRFKEHNLWGYDGLDGYYTSPARKYLVYQNPGLFATKEETRDREIEALRAALSIGHILNRTLILPMFHCDTTVCPLNALLCMTSFDAHFNGSYRESTFLQNTKVPDTIRTSTSDVILIESRVAPAKDSLDEVKIKRTPRSLDEGPDSAQIEAWFASDNSIILRFHSMYKAFGRFTNQSQQAHFDRRLRDGIAKCDYRQLKIVGLA